MQPPSLRNATGQALSVREAAIDIAFVLAALFLVKAALLQFAATWTFAGPASLLASLAVASWRLRRTGKTWHDLGLKKPAKVRTMLMWSLLLLVVTMASGTLTENITVWTTGNNAAPIDPRYANRFADVPGNAGQYLYWIGIGWLIGGFAEEMLFRAMLISRFERLFARFPYPALIGVVLQSIIFGQQHYYYQGLQGALATGAIALISGTFYVLLKRQLWPLILSHGTANMIGLTVLYLSGL